MVMGALAWAAPGVKLSSLSPARGGRDGATGRSPPRYPRASLRDRVTGAGVPSFVAAAGCHRRRRVPRVGWPPHGRAPTSVRASATGGSDGIDTPDEPVFIGKKGRMAKMVDMSRRELGESDALQGVQVFLVEFGLIAMGVVDTLMVGHVCEAALAAACLGGTTTWLVMITAIGLLGALDPLTSQAFGAEDDAAVKRHLRSGLYASVALNAGCMLILTMAVAPLYAICGQPSLLAAAASHYCHIEAWGILPVLLFQAIRLSLMSTNVFRPLVVAITIANATNVALNQVLINGMTVANITIPALGLTGAAWATVTSRWILLMLTCAFAYEELKSRDAFKPIRESVSSALERAGGIVKRSLPIGGQMLMEFGAFAALTLIAGRCGTTQAAGHAIVQCLTDMSYVLPLGIGALGSIKVGQGVGGGDGGEAQRAARMSMLRGVYGVAINAFIYVVFGKRICWWFTSDPAVHAVAVSILPVVAAYQAADGVRVVSAGCLRGVGRLNTALLSDVVGFWVLGIPVGYYLAVPLGMNAMGIWLGFAFGVMAVMMPICVKAWNVGSKEEKLLDAPA